MAKIIDNENKRRIIRLSTDDILSVVQAYQTAGYRAADINEIRNRLQDIVVYIPEEI